MILDHQVLATLEVGLEGRFLNEYFICDLINLFAEAHQEVPSWFESVAYDSRPTCVRRTRGGLRKYVSE